MITRQKQQHFKKFGLVSCKLECSSCRMQIIFLSFLLNIIFVIIKGVIGFLAGSHALMADALHSLSDTASLGLNYSISHNKHDVPRDLSPGVNAVICVIIVSAGFWVIGRSTHELFTGQLAHPGFLSLIAAIIATIVNGYLYIYSKCANNNFTDSNISVCLILNRTNFISSSLAFVGILLAELGFMYFDPVCAIMIGCIMLTAAYEIFNKLSFSRLPFVTKIRWVSLICVLILSLSISFFYVFTINKSLSQQDVILIPSMGPLPSSPAAHMLGRAKYFYIIDTANNYSYVVTNINLNYFRESDSQLLTTIKDYKVNIVLTEQINKKIFDELSRANLKMYFIDNPGTVQQVFLAYKNKTLEIVRAPNKGKGYGRGKMLWGERW
jgi:Co/Zn/Cd efflux system component/predicted Fe-Mo cluster-binding NifX family protein